MIAFPHSSDWHSSSVVIAVVLIFRGSVQRGAHFTVMACHQIGHQIELGRCTSEDFRDQRTV
jgi:hypothetical protein